MPAAPPAYFCGVLAADLVAALFALAVPDLVDFLLFLAFFVVEALLCVCAFGVAGALGAGVDCAITAAAVSAVNIDVKM